MSKIKFANMMDAKNYLLLTTKEKIKEELDKDLITRVARFASSDLSGVSSFIGGIVAQEVVKKTGK